MLLRYTTGVSVGERLLDQGYATVQFCAAAFRKHTTTAVLLDFLKTEDIRRRCLTTFRDVWSQISFPTRANFYIVSGSVVSYVQGRI